MRSGRARLDHIAIAVEDLELARDRFRAILGCEPSPIEHIPSENVRVSFFELENCRIELVAADGPAGPIHDFIARGRRGLHHIAISPSAGTSLVSERERLENAGIDLARGGIREGSEGSEIVFIHPRSALGVLVELVSPRAGRTSEPEEEGRR